MGVIDEVRQDREDLARVLKKHPGIRKTVEELYPDKTHFIFELLQNAEDTGATEVRFILSKNDFVFEHNGRPFNIQDIYAITDIGSGTKAGDPTSIGKFGVGFKAVFAFTNTPEICSGDFNFRIRDLVMPEEVEVSNGKRVNGATRFVFPFDNPKKPPADAYNEINSRLSTLADNTLLFLHHIRKISYQMPDGAVGSLERREEEQGQITIKSNHHGRRRSAESRWLRFQKDVQVRSESGISTPCRIAIAFSLVSGMDKRGRPLRKVAPLERGQVSIYFPADKETSNLRFHLHAPFASTVARDSVRDCKENQKLRDHLSKLVVESLEKIQDQGLLTIDFLAVLPNAADGLPGFYAPIHLAVVDAFKKRELTPTRSGSHAPANELYRGPARIQDVIDDGDLSLLTRCDAPLWAKNPRQENQREDKFLDSLAMNVWGWESLSLAFRRPHHQTYSTEQESENAVHASRIEAWVAAKDDLWLMKFYALLGEAHDVHKKALSVDGLRIVRTSAGGNDNHVFGEKAFFHPGEGATVPIPGAQFVKLSVYDAGRSESVKRYAKSFLERAGVRLYDAKALIEWLVDQYESGEQPKSLKTHLSDIQQFVAYWKEEPDCFEMFEDCAFLYGEDNLNQKGLYKPSSLYLDSPYCATGLQALFDNPEVWLEKPKKRMSDDYRTIANFTEFSIAVGAFKQLEISKHKATEMQGEYFIKSGRQTYSTVDEDFFINGLHWYVARSNGHIGDLAPHFGKNLSLSILVWRLICSADPKVLTARYIPNRSRSRDELSRPSFLVDYLAQHPWIPDRDGVFHLPKNISHASLHPELVFDDRNGWLTAIGFGRAERSRSQEGQEKNEVAQSFGYDDAEHMDLALLATTGMSKHDLARWTAERSGSAHEEFPEKLSPNPERRRIKMVGRRENAPSRESVRRERTFERGLANIKAEAKAYLRDAYTNENGRLICQCCRDPMPFKLPKTDRDYFEAVQLIDGLAKQYYENYLALCPICSAKYQHACQTEPEAVKQLFLETKPDGKCSVEIQIQLAGTSASIRFVAVHALDLNTILG